MFTIAGGTAQVLRTLVASRILGTIIPQTRNGYLESIRASSLAAK
jgi:3-sulfinopropanoyl-CoA desulfinase